MTNTAHALIDVPPTTTSSTKIRVALRERFQIIFREAISPAGMWGLKRCDSRYIQFIDDFYIPPPKNIIGSTTHVFKFRAVMPGITRVVFVTIDGSETEIYEVHISSEGIDSTRKNMNNSLRWISTDRLADHLNDKNLTIIDAQPHFMDYIESHIPNAIYMSEKLFRSYNINKPCVHVPPKAIGPILRRYGIRHDMPIVVYTGKGSHGDSGNGLSQTMVAYSLIRSGHNNVFILDGGFDKWKGENKKTTKIFPVVKHSNFRVDLKTDALTINMTELKRIKDSANVVLLDARPAKAYEGQAEWIKPGHIPGAVNLPWTNLMDKKNTCLLKSAKEIQDIFNSKGATKDKIVICSCGTSREATAEFTLLKWYLKYPNVRIYEGSFTEWSRYSDRENPTVTGPYPYRNSRSP